MACLGKTEATDFKANAEKTEPNPGMMQFVAEHQVVPKEEATVKPVKGRKKRRRGRKPASGQHEEPKELTRSDCGSGNKLAAACRKMTRHARVAWHRENFTKKDWTRNQAEQETPKRRNDGKILWKGLEYSSGLRNRGLSQQLHGKTGIKDPHTRQWLRLGNKRTTNMI
jgi:hypothetical protein